MLIFLGMLLAGLVVLVLSGDWLVRGAVAFALRLGVSRILASIIIVGFGTSLPEMMIAIDATVIKDRPGLAISGLIGSNIVNILLVLGLPAVFLTIRTTGQGLMRSVLVTGLATIAWLVVTPLFGLTPGIGFAFLGALLAYILSALFLPGSEGPDVVDDDGGGDNRWLSVIIFLILLVQAGLLAAKFSSEGGLQPADFSGFALVLIGFVVLLVIPSEKDMQDREGQPRNEGWSLIVALIGFGIVGLPLGAHFMTTGALGIADQLNVRSEIVGLTLIALGTSLPELAAALAATLRRENDMILGNVAGSNMFNLFGAGGIIAILPLFTEAEKYDLPGLFLKFDHWIMAITFAVFFLYVLFRRSIGWLTGLVFLAGYVGYLAGIYYFHNLGQTWADLWELTQLKLQHSIG